MKVFLRWSASMKQGVLLAFGCLAGLGLAYLDALPSWDDDGVLAGGLLLASGLLASLGYRRPWLIALAVGLWIPLRNLYRTHDVRILLVLIIPMMGAYAGWLLRRAIRRASA